MNFRHQDYYVRPAVPRLVPGSISLHVPIVYAAGQRLPAIGRSAGTDDR